MEFEVEIITKVVKRVTVNADSLPHAREVAQHLDQTGMFANARCTIEGKKYTAYVRCSHCGKHVSFYYTPDDTDKPICLSCFSNLTQKWQSKTAAHI